MLVVLIGIDVATMHLRRRRTDPECVESFPDRRIHPRERRTVRGCGVPPRESAAEARGCGSGTRAAVTDLRCWWLGRRGRRHVRLMPGAAHLSMRRLCGDAESESEPGRGPFPLHCQPHESALVGDAKCNTVTTNRTDDRCVIFVLDRTANAVLADRSWVIDVVVVPAERGNDACGSRTGTEVVVRTESHGEFVVDLNDVVPQGGCDQIGLRHVGDSGRGDVEPSSNIVVVVAHGVECA